MFGQDRAFKKAFVLNPEPRKFDSKENEMDQELSEIVDAGRFKRSPIHVFDSNFTLSDLENLTIFQCPFVGGFVHLTEQNFNFLRNDSRFDKVVGGN
jgi:hypothetical protein